MVTNMVNREKYMGTEDFKRSIEIIKNFINTYLNKDIQGFQDFDLDKPKTSNFRLGVIQYMLAVNLVRTIKE